MLEQLKDVLSKLGIDDTVNEIRKVNPSRMQIFLSHAILHASCCYQIPGFNLCKHAVRKYAKAYDAYPAEASWAIVENAILQSAFTNAFVTTLKTLEANGDLLNEKRGKEEEDKRGSNPFQAPQSNLNL